MQRIVNADLPHGSGAPAQQPHYLAASHWQGLGSGTIPEGCPRLAIPEILRRTERGSGFRQRDPGFALAQPHAR